VADVNGDGKPDLAVANYDSNTVSVLRNRGEGTFAAKVDYAAGAHSWWVAAADLDGDGKPDLAVANYDGNTVSVLRNRGDGTFAAKVDYPTGSGPRSIAVMDLNGDGKLDLAVANGRSPVVADAASPTVSVLLNNGDGTFAARVDLATGSHAWSVAAADLDGDGKPDLAVANHDRSTVSVLLNACPP
jgi:hypothetical protein